MRSFDYLDKTNVIFGAGRFVELPNIVGKYGNICLLVTVPSEGVLEPIFEQAKQMLEENDIKVFHFDEVVPNPTREMINKGIGFAKNCGINVIVGIGGGSSMDTAKAISIGLKNDGDIWDYRVVEGKPIKNDGLPVILTPTTSGTGSHVTQAAVLTNTEERFKSAVCKPDFFPAAAIVDPVLMRSLPQIVRAATGFDAFTHLFEAYINTNGNAYTDLLALDGMSRVIKNLGNAVYGEYDIEVLEQLAWADTLAGYCITNCGTVLPHGIAMAISGNFPRISHGEALAVVYPHFMEFTFPNSEFKFARVAHMFNPGTASLTTGEAAEKSCEEILKLLKHLRLNKKLSDFGLHSSDIEKIAEDTFKLPDYMSNPRIPNKREVYEIMINCL